MTEYERLSLIVMTNILAQINLLTAAINQQSARSSSDALAQQVLSQSENTTKIMDHVAEALKKDKEQLQS